MLAVEGVDVYIEQPCLSYEECLAVRRRTSHPFVLDETIDSVDVLLRAHAEGAPQSKNGKMAASTEPGLGVRPRRKVLGRPLVEVAARRAR